MRHLRRSPPHPYRIRVTSPTGASPTLLENVLDNHEDLLELLKSLPRRVILSGDPSASYDDALQGWRSIELQVVNQDGVRTEKLWFSFTVDRVHWAAYAGRNFTRRQQIKRNAANWARRYEALPRAQRLAVISAMMAAEVREESQP